MGFSRVSQKVGRYRSDSMGKGSADEKVVVYNSGSFVTGVVQTRDYCTVESLQTAYKHYCIKYFN